MLLPIFGASEDGDRAWGHHLHDVWNVESVGSGSHDSPEGGKSLPLQNTHEHGCRTYMAGFSVRDSWGSSSCIGIFELNRIIVLSVQPPLLLSFGQGKKKKSARLLRGASGSAQLGIASCYADQYQQYNTDPATIRYYAWGNLFWQSPLISWG